MNALYKVTYDRDWTWIHFPGGKPADEVLAALRSFARFSSRRVAWYITSRLDESDIAARLSVSDTAHDPAPVVAGDKIKAVKFELYRAEGPIDDSDDTGTASTWTDADNILRHWALTAPEPGHGYYNKCDFKITYADGNTYEGRYDLKQHDTGFPELLAYHIRGFQEFRAGVHRPEWMSDTKYTEFLKDNYSPEAAGFLARYEIGETVAPAPTQTPANESDRARAWFESLDLESIPLDQSVTVDLWKHTVAVFRHAEPFLNGDRFSLYTRSPQQKQHLFTSTGRARGNSLDDLRPGFERFIAEQEDKQTRASARRDAKRQARAAFVNPYKVGDFLYSSWGYDQTNREFYQVLEVRPTALKIREVAQGHESTGYDSWDCWPHRDQFVKGPAQWVTIQVYENGSHDVPSPIHGSLYLWEGKPLYASNGH